MRADDLWTTIEPWMLDIRRKIHRHPELGLDTPATANLVFEELQALGLRPRRLIDHGIIADVGESQGAKRLLLRADMDGLPIDEAENGLAFRSEVPGRMHACGHDAHTAMLLAAVRFVLERGKPLARPLRLMFQPGEEGPGGAEPMIQAGALSDEVGAALMIHVHSELSVGTIGLTSGPAMASTNDFRIVVTGRGGHGAHPDRGIDAIYVASTIVQSLQSLVSREQDPTDPLVISIGTIHGGDRENIIAREVVMTGTVRTLNAKTRARVLQRITDLVATVAQAHRAHAELALETGYPPLITDRQWTKAVSEAIRERVPAATVIALNRPSMGAEDFAYIAQEVPAAVINLGVAHDIQAVGLHAAGFVLAEPALLYGAKALVAVVDHTATHYG